jgi:crossover junction endodeoxyribonuclease RuvC
VPTPTPLSGPVLGVDPGSRRTGWGLVRRVEGRYRLVAAGVIVTDGEAAMAERLATIHAGLVGVIATHGPSVAAIEAIFSHRSATSALVLGQARGVALLALAQAGLPVREYNAASIKRTIGGSGRAEKAHVARMVEALLGEPVAGPADASDAVAIALTHCAHGASTVQTPRRAGRTRGWTAADLAAARARVGG